VQELKSKADLELMREAGRIVAITLDALEQAAQPGVTLNELDRIASDHIKKHKAVSSFFNYRVDKYIYPKVLCTSVNDVVVHGIPDGRKLVEGDIVGLDFGVSFRGFHGDAARTVAVGQIAPDRQRIIDVTRRALELAVDAAIPNNRVMDIGRAVQTYVEAQGYSVVRDFVGHGIGRRMHESPQVPNYVDKQATGRLKTGMCLALEPMVNAGTYETERLPDGWTVVTRDRKISAHFEHTVSITDNGPVILTLP
jgi:methionyl aminopeptidase